MRVKRGSKQEIIRNTWLSPKKKSKMKYMKCMFIKKRNVSSLEEKVGDHIIPEVT